MADTVKFDPQKIKLHLQMFVMMSGGMIALFPGEAGKTIKNIFDILTAIMNQEWFPELLAYLLNTFEDGQITQEELAGALEYFADRVRKTGTAPIIMK